MERLQSMQHVPGTPKSSNVPILILTAGVAAEVLLPWLAAGLSDTFFFDIPRWGLWALFGGPLVLTLVALLVHRALLVREPSADWKHHGTLFHCH